jgi:hypothetical protein
MLLEEYKNRGDSSDDEKQKKKAKNDLAGFEEEDSSPSKTEGAAVVSGLDLNSEPRLQEQ